MPWDIYRTMTAYQLFPILNPESPSIFKQTNRDLYLHGLEIRLPKPFETWNNMKRLIDRIVIRQFPDLNEDLILVTNRTHFSDSLKAHLNDLHVKAVFDNMPGKISQSYG